MCSSDLEKAIIQFLALIGRTRSSGGQKGRGRERVKFAREAPVVAKSEEEKEEKEEKKAEKKPAKKEEKKAKEKKK